MFGKAKREPAEKPAREAASREGLPVEGERFACRPYSVVHAGGQENLVAIAGTAGTAEVEQGVLLLMEQLQRWGDIDEQISRLEAAGIPLSRSELSSSLERMRSIGALWTERELVGALRSQPPRAPCPISDLMWCTRDRSELLARSMKSFLGARGASGPVRVTVLDDSADTHAAAAGAEIVRAASEGRGARGYRFIGSAERAEIVRRLAALAGTQGVSSRCIDFLLGVGAETTFGAGATFRVGASRNLGTLLTAGGGYLSADDDTLAAGVAGRDPETVGLSSEFEPTLTDFYADDEACARIVGLPSIDLAAEHGRYLGRGVGEIVAGARSGVELTSLRSSFAQDLLVDQGEVILTETGVLGDSGLATPRVVFHLDGEQRARWIDEPEGYSLARLARHVHRRVERPTISSSRRLVGIGYALDNRGLVPPTFPFGRKCETFLGTMIRLCRPSSYFLQLPIALRRQPAPRSFTEGDLHGYTAHVCDFMVEAAEACPVSRYSRSPEARLAGLAAHFRGIAELSLPHFAEAVRSIWMSSANRYVQSLLAQLDRRRYSPPEWAEDVVSHIESLLSFLEGPTPLVPIEFSPASEGSRATGESVEQFRSAVGLYGEALEAWPVLRECARDPAIQSIGTETA